MSTEIIYKVTIDKTWQKSTGIIAVEELAKLLGMTEYEEFSFGSGRFLFDRELVRIEYNKNTNDIRLSFWEFNNKEIKIKTLTKKQLENLKKKLIDTLEERRAIDLKLKEAEVISSQLYENGITVQLADYCSTVEPYFQFYWSDSEQCFKCRDQVRMNHGYVYIGNSPDDLRQMLEEFISGEFQKKHEEYKKALALVNEHKEMILKYWELRK